MKPIHTHDCDRCIHLYSTKKEDHYVCPSGALGETWIIRYGSEGPAYSSRPRHPHTKRDILEAKKHGIEVPRWCRVYMWVYESGPQTPLSIQQVSIRVFSLDPAKAAVERYRERVESITIGKVVELAMPPTQFEVDGAVKYHAEDFTKTMSLRTRPRFGLVEEDPNEDIQ